jgi:hypothetical protein
MRALTRPRDVPLSVGSVDGWRAWSVVERDGDFLLSSLTRAEDWEPSAPFVASCGRRAHQPPHRGCSCGVYAAAEPEELGGLGRIAGAVIGQVSLWGRIAEHSRGYRAAIAYPARLRLVCVTCLGQGEGIAATRVDRDVSPTRSRLLPLCERHAAGRALPPARPFEDRLLAAYRVEPVPDGSLVRIRRDLRRERAERRTRRGLTMIVAAAVSLLALVAVSSARSREDVVVSATSSASHAALGPQVHGGIRPLHDRADSGPVHAPPMRLLRQPQLGVIAPMCGALTPIAVVVIGCGDPRTEVFVHSIGSAGTRPESTCGDQTAALTRTGYRIQCWWLLPQT